MSMTPEITKEGERLLQDGKAAAKRGDKVMARSLLTQLVELEPNSEQAWMWLSGVVGDVQEQIICLENVLVINPNNKQAQKGLEYISAKNGLPSRDNVPTPQVPAQSAATHAPDTVPSNPAPAQWGASANGGTSPFMAGAASPVQGGEPPPWAKDDSQFASPGESAASAAPQPAAQGNQPAQWDAMFPSAPASENATAHFTQGEATNTLPSWGQADNGSAMLPSWDASDTGQAGGAAVDDSFDTLAPFDPSAMQPFGAASSDGGGQGVPSWLNSISPAPTSDLMSGPSANPVESQPTFSSDPIAGTQEAPAPFDPFGAGGGADFGPMGPYTAGQLPTPDQLPGLQESGAAQPWYLQASNTSTNIAPPPAPSPGQQPFYLESSHLTEAPAEGISQQTKTMPTIECPSCHEQVPETAIACPNCKYSFFVNCPSCHELIDTGEAGKDGSQTCPHCNAAIDSLKLGLARVGGSVPYQSESLKGEIDSAFPSMRQVVTETSVGSARFGWVVDLLWLVAIVAMVWALTQLPTWLRLTGQY